MKRLINSYTGEPSSLEYGKVMDEINKSISTKGFKCTHNNAGWSGYYITTPQGNKYQLVKNSYGDKKYYLCEYSSKPFSTGKSLDVEFNDLEECKEYLLTIE